MMTQGMNWEQWYREQRDWHLSQIEWNNKQIAWLTEELRRSRVEDKELMEFVWRKGVLNRTEMEIWGKPSKYESRETRTLKAQRKREYKSRKWNMERAEFYENKLKEVG